MVKSVFSTVLIILLVSCQSSFKVPIRLQQGFLLCYQEQDNQFANLNINGHFRKIILRDRYGTNECKEHIIDTSFHDIIINRDGTVLSGFLEYLWWNKKDERWVSGNNIKQYLNRDLYKGKKIHTHVTPSMYGIYQLQGDTIKMNFIFKNRLTPGAWEEWYKIIDKNTIVLIYKKLISYPSEVKRYMLNNNNGIVSNAIPYKFFPLDEIPSSDDWLKKEKWLWCKEEDWQHYMDSLVAFPK